MKDLSLNRIISKTKKYVFGDLLGNNSSKILGDGYDFAQISPYVFGENIRRIDPYSSAKKNELHVREYFESKEANIHVVICASGSLHFGTRAFKQDKIAEIIALLGFSVVKNADSFSLGVISDKVEYQSYFKKSKNSIINSVDTFLKMDMRKKKFDKDFLNDYLLHKIKKRSMIFLISDFFENIELKSANKKHQIIALKIRDIFENEPQNIGEVSLLNPSTLETQEAVFDESSIKKYKKRLRRHDLELGQKLKQSGIPLVDIYTHENVYMKLEKFFRGL